jgi:predicted ATP-dependent endonuclease of OLD family
LSIKSIKIKNLLSFEEVVIPNLEDINCIVGKNNTGKSNLLKLIRYFYNKLENKRELPPELNSKYSSFGTITIIYDVSRIKNIVTSDINVKKSTFFKHIYNTLFKNTYNDIDTYELTLQINSNDSVQWSTNNKDVLNIISYLYPFFNIEARHIDLHDWDKLWSIVSRMKSFNVNNIKQGEIIEFFDERISDKSNSYKEYVSDIESITKTGKYNYKEKVLNYVKAGLQGQTFLINDESLEVQSDGTNSHKFIEIALELLITLSRREYISPSLYIDEPETGLHPKKNEELIYKLFNTYNRYKKTSESKEKKKYKTPYPKIIMATHSPNIVKEIIKLFDKNQQILHFSKNKKNNTVVQTMNSVYDDKRFLNIFDDNEARLFFSNFILFVEGPTEKEVFSNKKLINLFINNKNERFLNKIDVYQTNELVLKYINPSYLNTAIPYLVLYDADKLIEIDFNSNKLNFKSKCLNLKDYISAYSKSYIKSKKYLIRDFLIQLFEWQKSFVIEITSNKLFISNINYKLLIGYINQNFAKKENYFFNKTTIEEVLINDKSFYLFKRWLFNEFRNSIDKSYNTKTPECVINIIKSNKIKEFRKFRKFMKEEFLDEKVRMTAFILIFGGKTDTSITKETENFDILDDAFKKNLKILKDKFITNKKSLNVGYLLGKTSGWVTSFINFSIIKIASKNKNLKEIKLEFKNNFEELYDIITIIEKKL